MLSSFQVNNNLLSNPGTARGAGTVPRQYIDTLAALPGVTSHLANMNATADMVNSEIFKLPGATQEFSDKQEQMFGNTLPVNAVNRSDLSPAFRAGTFKLSEGRHLTEDDTHKALIHKDYAEKNGLKVGDKLAMRANQFDEDNRFGSTATVEAEIVGTFTGEDPGGACIRADLYQNALFTDLDTARTLNGTSPENEYYENATFYASSLENLDSAMKAAQGKNLEWQRYQLRKATDE